MIRFLTTLLSLVFSVALLAIPQAAEQTLLFEGAQVYTFYSREMNSQAQIKVVSPQKALKERRALLSYTGESAFYECQNDAFEQAEKYDAKLQFTQSVQGSTDYYCYSPKLRGGIVLQGKSINLHICVRNNGATIGSPLIFGGC